MTDIEERLQTARLGMTIGIDALLLEAAAEIRRLRTTGAERYWEARWRDEAKENELLLAVIEKLNTEIERQRAERDVWKIACNAQADEVERLRAERRVIPGTNIPDADTPSY